MHRALPLSATKIKHILALANEDGMRGGARLGEMAEDDLGRVVRAASLQPEPHGVALYVLWTWSPQLSVPQHESIWW